MLETDNISHKESQTSIVKMTSTSCVQWLFAPSPPRHQMMKGHRHLTVCKHHNESNRKDLCPARNHVIGAIGAAALSSAFLFPSAGATTNHSVVIAT